MLQNSRSDGDKQIDEVDPLNKQWDISATKWLYESGVWFFSEQRRISKLSFKCFQEPNILISKNNIKKALGEKESSRRILLSQN